MVVNVIPHFTQNTNYQFYNDIHIVKKGKKVGVAGLV